MGTFLRNLQVRFGDTPTPADHARLVAVVHRLLDAAGFVVTDTSADADRTIAIASHDSRPRAARCISR